LRFFSLLHAVTAHNDLQLGVCALVLPAAIYQLLAIAAAVRHLARRRARFDCGFRPGVSVLKPVYGLDPDTYAAFVSQIRQDYPDFEVLFGVRDKDDPAAIEIRRLQNQFPSVPVRLIAGGVDAPNGKVGVLIELARYAKHPIWLVNDSDIKVTPGYLAEVVAPLADDSIGVVTCLYKATAHSPAARWEALGIATDFMPSTLVAQMLRVRDFGLGSTLAFHKQDLEAAGGFVQLAEYLADDYQLTKRITSSGKRAVISSYVVETALGNTSWVGVWRHQVRWARTIRVSKGGGYAGLPITQAGIWILIAIICGAWVPAIFVTGVRIVSALLTGGLMLRSMTAAVFCWVAPLWDLFAFCVWCASYMGSEVRWRDRVLRIDREGRIQT
jgi:ceramide glucosyltransferase